MENSTRTLLVATVLTIVTVTVACGKPHSNESSRPTTLNREMWVPASGQVSGNAAQTLYGRYRLSDINCRAVVGNDSTPKLKTDSALSSKLFIEASTVTMENLSEESGCKVTATFKLEQAGTNALVLTNRQLKLSRDGSNLDPDDHDCDDLMPTDTAKSSYYYEYKMTESSLSLLYGPSDICRSNEKDEDVYVKF